MKFKGALLTLSISAALMTSQAFAWGPAGWVNPGLAGWGLAGQKSGLAGQKFSGTPWGLGFGGLPGAAVFPGMGLAGQKFGGGFGGIAGQKFGGGFGGIAGQKF